MAFPWHSWCQFCRKTPNECSLPALEDIRDNEVLLSVALKFFSNSMSKRLALFTCPDCKTFLDQILNFSHMCVQTHAIYMELRKKCTPDEYELEMQAELEAQKSENLEGKLHIVESDDKSEFFEIVIPVDDDDEEQDPATIVTEAEFKKEGTVYEEIEDEDEESLEIGLSERKSARKRQKPVKNVLDVECEECGQVCPSGESLKRHMNNHKKEKAGPSTITEKSRPFECKECGKRWATKGSLKEHMIIHSDDRPFKCSHCSKLFKNQQRLKIHEDTHTDTAYICPLCGLQLNTKRTLTMHMVVHSEVKKYKCEYCGNEYKRAKALKAHMVIHTGMRPYSCPFCDKTFANGSNCRSHKRKAHPEQLAAQEAAEAEEGRKQERVLPSINELKTNLISKAAESEQLITIIPYDVDKDDPE